MVCPNGQSKLLRRALTNGLRGFPLTRLINPRLADYRQLRHTLKNRNFSKASVEATIIRVQHLKKEIPFLQDDLNDYLVALSRRSDILLQLGADVLRSYIASSQQSILSHEIADNVSMIADSLCRVDLGIIAPLFDFLASSLTSEKLNATFCFAVAFAGDDLQRCIRLAESMRKFAHETSLGLLLVRLHCTKPDWLQKPKLLRSFQPLLSSPLLDALASHVGEETVSSIRALVKATDRFRDAVIVGDRIMARRILANETDLAKVDFFRWMNSLRSLSYELKRMMLPVSDLKVPGIDDPIWQKLAAIRFFDDKVISKMRDTGELEIRNDLNATALSIIGDNSMLNSIISEKYDTARLDPMKVDGKSASQVFMNAAASTRSLKKVEGPLITVIMSAYNPDLELMEISLDSIRDQTLNNLEIIVVDDASDDPHKESIRELTARYSNAKLIRTPVNSGPYIGRNLAIEEARGTFIAIQDADDWSHPQRLATQVHFLLSTPEARAVTTEHIRINRAGDIALESGFRVFGDGPMTSLFRADVFHQIGRFALTRSRGDLEMHERIAAYYGNQANAALPLPMMLCYAHSSTLSNSIRTKKVHHIKLFHNNIMEMQDLTSLFREDMPLSGVHQIPVPIMLRAP